MNEEILKQILQKLEYLETTMATKDDLAMMADKMATKEELAAIAANMATKEELAAIAANMATKDDLDATNEKLTQLTSDVALIAKKLDLTFEQVAKSAEAIYETAATQEEHKDILDELSIRYIEQAAAVRRVKKKQADASQVPTPA
ncbi:hypothetical protein [Paenibacillus jiagnxiensis]|uniref:hypothetical protein n=1 Tax=Paenibacillus jiagnxiensis TaxID=3228926 RepID=UPI0033A6987E